MKQSINQVELYRKINSEKAKEAKIDFYPLELSYERNDVNVSIDLSAIEDTDIAINKFDSMWCPHVNELKIKQELIIGNPKALFGENGVTCEENQIGYAVHIHSKDSYFQVIKEIGSISFEDKEGLKLTFEEYFESDFLRGIINLDFFLYLKEVQKTKPYFASKKGMKLTSEDLNSYRIIVDGSGPSFPITDFSEKDGQLWKVNKNWIDASEDSFDSSNVSLMINKEHPLHRKLLGDGNKSYNSLLVTLVLQVMAMIIDDVINKEQYNPEDDGEIVEGTILAAVEYWIKTYEIQTHDIFTIQNSLFGALEDDLT